MSWLLLVIGSKSTLHHSEAPKFHCRFLDMSLQFNSKMLTWAKKKKKKSRSPRRISIGLRLFVLVNTPQWLFLCDLRFRCFSPQISDALMSFCFAPARKIELLFVSALSAHIRDIGFYITLCDCKVDPHRFPKTKDWPEDPRKSAHISMINLSLPERSSHVLWGGCLSVEPQLETQSLRGRAMKCAASWKINWGIEWAT